MYNVNKKNINNGNLKLQQLNHYKVNDLGKIMTTNQGVKISEDEFSLKAGVRGPTLMEDFHFREKMTHFDHERIPERVVHARGAGAHGEFQVYQSMRKYTKARFLQNPIVKTPVFVRFSTVVGSKGSPDTVRDVRGMATKFYTDEGNYDLVNNNMAVFFIQDGIKFPDIVHAIKPEPHNEIPQATAAHDTLWDFIVNNQETAHQIMWLMSDRAIPRSFRMMEGFSINTFRFVNEEGIAHFVRFHWKPLLGIHSLVWDEARKISGIDPDYHRRDLYEAIESGDYPEYEFGVQMIKEEDEFKFDFDILDATKLWPEEEVPVNIIGKMTLNRNVDNFFAETEQVAFHPGHVVPGIDFTNDPLLQARLFSYLDTQLIRLGGPNFHEIPINKPLAPFHNNQRDGYHRQTINIGKVSYHKNSIAFNSPTPVSKEKGGYAHYQEKVEGKKIRARSESFKDHFSQAIIFWNSMSPVEKVHIIDAFTYEVGSVKDKTIRQKVVDMFANVNIDLATCIAYNVGVNPPTNNQIKSKEMKMFPSLSQENTITKLETRKVAVIITDGFTDGLIPVLEVLQANGLYLDIISDRLGVIKGENTMLEAKNTFITTSSVLYDSVLVVGGKNTNAYFDKNAQEFVKEAYLHFKPIGALSEGRMYLQQDNITSKVGVVEADYANEEFVKNFLDSIKVPRHWNRDSIY